MAEEHPRDDDRARRESAPRAPHRERPNGARSGGAQGRKDGSRPYRKDGERPERRDGDRPYRKDGDRPYRKEGDRPQRQGRARPQRTDGDRAYRKDGDRPQRRDGDRPYRKDGERPPRRDGERPYRNDGARPQRTGGDRPYGKDGDRSYRTDGDRPGPSRGGRPSGGKPSYRSDDRRAAGGSRPTRPPQDQRVSGPEIPDDVTPRELHGAARGELKTLSKENAEMVARHLVMASRLIDDDPQLAHEHALAASRSAGRVGIVRETVAITAYAIGDFALALRELRTYRRISGKDDQIALMVDSERGVGRPDRAIEVGRAVDRDTLDTAGRVQLAIAMSGARLDLGQTDRALLELEIPEFDPDTAYSWSADLFSARAHVLEELGREAEAAEFHRRADLAATVWDSAHGPDDVLEIDEIDETPDADEPSAEEAD